jgi:hypothetical protein
MTIKAVHQQILIYSNYTGFCEHCIGLVVCFVEVLCSHHKCMKQAKEEGDTLWWKKAFSRVFFDYGSLSTNDDFNSLEAGSYSL